MTTSSQIKWKTNQSTKINLIGCDTIVNSPSLFFLSQKKSFGTSTMKYQENSNVKIFIRRSFIPLELSSKTQPLRVDVQKSVPWSCLPKISPLKLYSKNQSLGVVFKNLVPWSCLPKLSPLELSTLPPHFFFSEYSLLYR